MNPTHKTQKNQRSSVSHIPPTLYRRSPCVCSLFPSGPRCFIWVTACSTARLSTWWRHFVWPVKQTWIQRPNWTTVWCNVTCFLKGVVSGSDSTPTAPPIHRFIFKLSLLPHRHGDRKEDEANAIKVLHLPYQWFSSLHCSGWPIWHWWRLLLFWGPYQSHGGQSTLSTQADLQPPWGAMGGGQCAIRGPRERGLAKDGDKGI